jgi:hypothetical protein
MPASVRRCRTQHTEHIRRWGPSPPPQSLQVRSRRRASPPVGTVGVDRFASPWVRLLAGFCKSLGAPVGRVLQVPRCACWQGFASPQVRLLAGFCKSLGAPVGRVLQVPRCAYWQRFTSTVLQFLRFVRCQAFTVPRCACWQGFSYIARVPQVLGCACQGFTSRVLQVGFYK